VTTWSPLQPSRDITALLCDLLWSPPRGCQKTTTQPRIAPRRALSLYEFE